MVFPQAATAGSVRPRAFIIFDFEPASGSPCVLGSHHSLRGNTKSAYKVLKHVSFCHKSLPKTSQVITDCPLGFVIPNCFFLNRT